MRKGEIYSFLNNRQFPLPVLGFANLIRMIFLLSKEKFENGTINKQKINKFLDMHTYVCTYTVP